MPSLDGYSLNEEIKKLRADVTMQMLEMREAFREVYAALKRIEPVKKVKKKKEVKVEEKSSS
jgi:cell division protein FtsL